MPLPLENLDDRTFRSLVDEARTRIPAYAPEWTNLNDSDPGMALVQLHAWLTETLLYRVNRLPDLAYTHFLNLVGITPEPARAAEAELTFRFRDLANVGDPLTILVPKGAQVGVDDPSLAEPLTFETAETLTGLNAAIAAIIVPSDDGNARQVVGRYDPDEATLALAAPFRPFGAGAPSPEMLVGILLRPHRAPKQDYFLDRFPEGELNLAVMTPQVHEPDASGAVDPGPLGRECLFPWQAEAESGGVEWAAYVHAGASPDLGTEVHWRKLALRGDDTAGLARSGHVYPDLPAGLPPVPFTALSREFWASLGLDRPPASKGELLADLESGFLVAADLPLKVWREDLGMANPPLQDLVALEAAILAVPEEDFRIAGVASSVWEDLGYSAAPAPYGLVWLRARQIAVPEAPPEVSGLHLNTVRATAATTRTLEVLGTAAGRPNQTFRLRRAPVLIDRATGLPDLRLGVVPAAGGDPVPWTLGEDFHGAGPDTPRFLLDPGSGTITFGDGVHGMIPVAGSRVVALGYRVGGGAVGNVGAGTIAALKTALPQVDSVSNLRAAAGGSDAESLDEAKLRAPSDLRARDRAVTAEDFADLAMRTPGVALRSAHALPLTRLDLSREPPALVPGSPGAVTVVVLPISPHPTPQPSEAELRLLCEHLNARRLITTELYVTGPRYQAIASLRAEIVVREGADLKATQDACHAALLAYFHPLNGGEDGQGWPFGGAIYHGNVFDVLLRCPGVARVTDLRIALDGIAPDDEADVLPVGEGMLVHLPPAAIALVARLGRG